VTGRPLGYSFVAVDALGFPCGVQGGRDGTTPQGTTTVDATTDTVGRLTASVPVPGRLPGTAGREGDGRGHGGDDDRHRRAGAPGEEPADDAGVARSVMSSARRRPT
jgi:hypothetical protein